jgi:hypothetical protein
VFHIFLTQQKEKQIKEAAGEATGDGEKMKNPMVTS